MTLGGWIGFICISVFILIISLVVAACAERGYTLAIGIWLLLSTVICLGMLWYYNNTQSGKRAFKSQESNFGDGIERTVKVYDVNGELITEYNGKFDVTYDADRILFDDENGKRHVIYYPTGTVIIDER